MASFYDNDAFGKNNTNNTKVQTPVYLRKK